MKSLLFVFCLLLFVCQTFQQNGPTEEEFHFASLEHAKIIPFIPQNISMLTIEEQAQFADPITKKYATNSTFSLRNLLGHKIIYNEKYYEQACSEINRTSIANLAYMTLHSPMKTGYQKIYDISLKMFQSCKWSEFQ